MSIILPLSKNAISSLVVSETYFIKIEIIFHINFIFIQLFTNHGLIGQFAQIPVVGVLVLVTELVKMEISGKSVVMIFQAKLKLVMM